MIPRGVALIGRGVSATTWNPNDKTASTALSNGDLTATMSALSQGVRANRSRSSGQQRFEVTLTTSASTESAGLLSGSAALTGSITFTGIGFDKTPNIRSLGSTLATLNGGGLVTGDIIAIEVDADTSEVWFQRFGEARQGPYTIPFANPVFPAVAANSGTVWTANFGATAWAITPTSGFLGWGA